MQNTCPLIAVAFLLAFYTGFTCIAFGAEPKQDANSVQPPPGRPMPRRMRIDPNHPNDINRQQMDDVRQQARERMRRRVMENMANQQRSRDPNISDAIMRERLESRRRQIMPMDANMSRETILQQRKAGIEEVTNQIEAKHRQRLAQLNRISELAKQQNDNETLGRVDTLLDKETKSYEQRMQRISRTRNMLESAGRPPSQIDANRPNVPTDINRPVRPRFNRPQPRPVPDENSPK